MGCDDGLSFLCRLVLACRTVLAAGSAVLASSGGGSATLLPGLLGGLHRVAQASAWGALLHRAVRLHYMLGPRSYLGIECHLIFLIRDRDIF